MSVPSWEPSYAGGRGAAFRQRQRAFLGSQFGSHLAPDGKMISPAQTLSLDSAVDSGLDPAGSGSHLLDPAGKPAPEASVRLVALPISLREANDFVEAFHRHSGRTSRDGGKFAIAPSPASRSRLFSGTQPSPGARVSARGAVGAATARRPGWR